MAPKDKQLPKKSPSAQNSPASKPIEAPKRRGHPLYDDEGPGVYWTGPGAKELNEKEPAYQRWKAGLLSPKGKADSPLPPSEPATSSEGGSRSSSNKAAKRMKKKEEERKSNDLMTCLTIREGEVWDPANPAVVVMKKPAASSTSSQKES
jgi:hypothetical protein